MNSEKKPTIICKNIIQEIESYLKVISLSIFSIASLVISFQMYEINQKNLEINDQSKLPVIVDSVKIVPESGGENYRYELIFKNIGGIIYDKPQIDFFSYIMVNDKST